VLDRLSLGETRVHLVRRASRRPRYLVGMTDGSSTPALDEAIVRMARNDLVAVEAFLRAREGILTREEADALWKLQDDYDGINLLYDALTHEDWWKGA
jgi:hypothetical protein